MKSFYFILILSLFACSRKPIVVYQTQERTVTHVDTILLKSVEQVPCEDFTDTIYSGKDTIYIEVVKKELSVKTVTRHDTIFRTTQATIVNPPARKIKIDNSIKAKNGTVGDNSPNKSGNTKKTSWLPWFLLGMASWFIIQKIGSRYLTMYFPFLKILF